MIDYRHQVEQIGDLMRHRSWLLVTAESCTGGGVAQALTSISGSSLWFDRGFVTYSNEAKQDMLAVDPALIGSYGAVSAEVVSAMVVGALQHSRAQLGLAVSGIAGPTGGSREKPVGTVWFAWAVAGQDPVARCVHFDGDRDQVRSQAVVTALQGLTGILSAGSDNGSV